MEVKESLARLPASIQLLVGLLLGGAFVYLMMMGSTLGLSFPWDLGLPLLAAGVAALAVWKATRLPLVASGIAAAAAVETAFWFYLFFKMGQGMEMFESLGNLK